MLYKELAEIYEKLESTSKRLEKTYHISEFLKKIDIQETEKILLLLQGKIYPVWEENEIGVASKLMVKAINQATGISIKEIENEWKKTGDLGDVALNLFKKKKQSSLFKKQLTLSKVFDNLRNVSEFEGKGTVEKKLQLISELLIHASPKEARYIVRTIIGDLRVGIGTGSIRDAIVWAYFEKEFNLNYDSGKIELEEEDRKRYNEFIEKIQHAYDLTNEFAVVIKTIKKKGINGLNDISLEAGRPLNVMLYQKVKDIEEAFEVVGRPAAFEFKYDGFRLQIHKTNNNIILFTRRLENVTIQFPEVVNYVKENVKASSCILDAEAVGYDPKTGKYLPFQSISQRIKRKYEVHNMAKQFPVEINIFDILFYNGKSLLKEPFKKRRQIIEKIVSEKQKKIVLAKQIITDKVEVADKFYKESLAHGEEGVMAKSLDAIYKPGYRIGYGVKIKPVMEPLDLVIIQAEYGEGKRSGWLTSYTLACWNNNKEKLLEIGKVSTGLKELDSEGISFAQITKLLAPLITSSKGKIVKVKPEIVIEVNYEEIQKSVNYNSGYALRFPRFSRLRQEKPVNEINTVEDVKRLYEMQRSRNK
ncbi:ATP-dependent DNA ligase [Candidatus Woesearchaeota archaeon]|nr:ATP-dependent DNA ligase [Candidatus Woesearchaeota archaeon]